jgi:hypothetical protein
MPDRAQILRIVLALAMTAAFAATGGSLLAGAEGGLSWVVPAFLLAIGVTANNPWILLVEILC